MPSPDLIAFASGIGEPVFLLEPDGRIVWANAAARALLGDSADDPVGRRLSTFLADDPNTVSEHLGNWARTTRPLPVRLHLAGAAPGDGGLRGRGFRLRPPDTDGPGLLCLTGLIGEHRSASSFTALNEQLAAQRQALRALERSRAQLALERDQATVTLYSIGDAVITTDATGHVQRLNRTAELLTGWRECDAMGLAVERVLRMVSEDTREPCVNPARRCLLEGRVVGLEDSTVLIAQDGTECLIEDSASPIGDNGAPPLGAVLVFRDVTAERLARKQLTFLAQHDALTTLHNRQHFEQQLEAAFSRAARGHERHAMVYFDLDQFKLVNDTAGHQVGDQLLVAVARRLLGRMRQGDTLARLGGDEFGLLVYDVGTEAALQTATDFLAALQRHVFSPHHERYQVGASAGVAMIDRGSHSAADVMRKADVACYVAKQSGRGIAHLYRDGDQAAVATVSEMTLVNDIRAAVTESRFRLNFQPIVRLADGVTTHHEVLLRMRRRDGPDEPIGQVIAASERYGLIGELDRWVIDSAFAEVARHQARNRGLTLTVNLSGASLGDPGIQTFIVEGLQRHGIPGRRIVFEITETAAVSRIERASTFMRELREHGFSFWLDDFGTGFSSFAYLKYLPVDALKIDGTFVQGLADDTIDQAMVRSIAGVASALGMSTVAECVECPRVRALLPSFGVGWAQGREIGRPAAEAATQPTSA